MQYVVILLVLTIIGLVGYYVINRKKIQQKAKENYLLKHKEEFDKQIQTEKEKAENELVAISKHLEEEKQRFDVILKKNLDDISWLDKKKEIAEEQYNKKLQEQEQAIQTNKEKQLRAVEEIVNERKARVNAEIDAYKEIETQKARTAVVEEVDAETFWAKTHLVEYWDELAQETQDKRDELAQVIAELDDYKKKQQVINEAILRQRAIDEQQDFYRVNLSEFAIEDIKLLQEIKQKLHTSDNLNKLIYDVYVSKSVQEMVKRVLQGAAPSGIYKITRLKTGEIYIGKSTNIKDRWIQHCKTVYGAGTIAHSILHTTMARDGLEQFIFEVVEEVPKEKLTEREKYWITFYGSKEYGLNEKNG